MLSNVLAICVACAIVKILRFNALYPAFLLLLGFLVFDIFWVFAGPILFNGHGIIHEVIQQIDFPLKLAVPGFSPFVDCAQLSIIDITIPTFYISFISRFGKEQGTNIYYLAHVITYAISLAIFTFMMVYTGSKQPALLYIIPSLFLATFITAGMRREWGSKLSMDSTLDPNGVQSNNGSPKKAADEETSARGMGRFDSKQFKGNEEEFQKFQDEAEEQKDEREEQKDEEKDKQ
mmetsp:Transcript_22349/g.19851  ORF Transcript_22349/g.19851 Transcript_22349/m.19851 type:complete len:234 (+) Transcript_22349:984-1685(+)